MKTLTPCLTLAMVVLFMIGFSFGLAEAGKCILPDFESSNFVGDPEYNTYFPKPDDGDGATYVYKAETEDELVINIIYISKQTVTINGVECTKVFDVEWVYVEDEEEGTGHWYMTEKTEDWHAWDNDGNFWYFGEWTTEFEFDDEWNDLGSNNEGSWKAGCDGAEPGIIIPADPRPGTCYKQEYYEDEAEDVGKVLRLNASVSIGEEDFQKCLVMKEWTPLSPGEVEHKYYAPEEGLVFIKELKGKTVIVELIDKIDGSPYPLPEDTPEDPLEDLREDLPGGFPEFPGLGSFPVIPGTECP